MGRYIGIVVFENALHNNVAMLVEDDDANPIYFETPLDVKNNISSALPCKIICIDVDNIDYDTIDIYGN